MASGAVTLPAEGLVVVFCPPGDYDLTALPEERLLLVQGFRPDHDALLARGYEVAPAPPEDYALGIVVVPRAKAHARALIAAAGSGGRPVIVDGIKTHGVESLLKDLRSRADVSAPLSKAHGKCFQVTAARGALEDWAVPAEGPEGWQTGPGLFSADGPDAGSVALANALPAALPGRVADLGAGWGYLAAAVLAREGVTHCDLVEADYDALSAARINVTDPRAAFHWADARVWTPSDRIDHVVMNPPFHVGRSADPGLGRAFIAAAARVLGPNGRLWMVANRHLPYEAALTAAFREVTDLPGPSGFKLTCAAKPVSQSRPRARR